MQKIRHADIYYMYPKNENAMLIALFGCAKIEKN